MTPLNGNSDIKDPVYVLHVMIINRCESTDNWPGYTLDHDPPLKPPPNPPAVIYTADELDENGVFQQAFAFQAKGEWTDDPRFKSEFVAIRQVKQDEIFVSEKHILILRPNEIVPLPGSFASEVFGVSHGQQFENAITFLEQAALDVLVTALGDDYFNCYGRSWPDMLVDVAAKELQKIDLKTADHEDILSLATAIVQQVPPPEY